MANSILGDGSKRPAPPAPQVNRPFLVKLAVGSVVGLVLLLLGALELRDYIKEAPLREAVAAKNNEALIVNAQAALRDMASAEAGFSSKATNRRYGTLQELAGQGYLDRKYLDQVDGYSYRSTEATEVYFRIEAIPADPANPSFYINHSMVGHYLNGDPCF